jgi:thiol-disulfide isomerase/thioredoxin
MVKAYTGAGRRSGDGRGRTLARFFLGGCLYLGASWTSAWGAPPPVSKMLEYKPRHEIACTTPAEAQQADCKVELVKGAAGSGWALKDGQGRLIRKFYSSNGTAVDSYSYYRDGVEVYREIVSPGARSPDQFRWLNAGGAKWGVDEDRNGTIDTWKSISPEEVSQEILKALATRDLARLQALMLTDADLATLGVPNERAEAIRARRAGVKAKFEATIAKLTKLGEKAKWTHLETGVPQCLPAELTGAKADIIRHTRATVLFESGENNEWFQVGTMYLVGSAWKIIDAPTPGAGGETEVVEDGKGKGGTGVGIDDPKTLKLVEALTELDKKAVPVGAAAVAHHIERSDLLEKIVASAKAEQRDPWIRQLADSLSSAVQAGTAADAPAVARLDSLEKQLVKAMPASNLTAYVAFRRMQADYSVKLAKNEKNFSKVQEDWLVTLAGFVKAYPKAEDTPDAMLQAGMVCEFLGKDADAKTWYTQLASAFKDKPQAVKAEGAIRRLSLEGDTMQVAAPLLKDSATPFDIASLKGKVVIVYYWASWNGQAVSDFAKLEAVAKANPKDVEILSVNLDSSIDEAKAFVAKNSPVGTHLYQAGGLDSRPATQYGITVLPSLFLVGKDGKCVNKSAQLGMMDDEVKKLLKK